jgi:TRAP-type transport system periplasmic protein
MAMIGHRLEGGQMKISIKSLMFASALAITAIPAVAQDKLRATWTDPNTPQTAPVSAYMNVLQSSAFRFSGGELDIELFPNGQLGDQRAMVQQVARGSLNFANIASGVLASLYFPELGIIDMPFLFKSRAHFRATMSYDNPFIKNLLDEVAAETGIRILSLHPYGFRNMTTKETAVHSPADMAGLRMRTMEIVPHQRMMESLGATAVPIPYLELYTSLQTGVVDGQENPPSNIILQRFYQVQGHMAETQHVMTVGAVLTNEKWYQSLTDAQRLALSHADAEASYAHDGIGSIQDLLGVQEIRDQGVEVYTPTPAEMAQFREATVGPSREWAEGEYGKEFVDGFFAHMESFNADF